MIFLQVLVILIMLFVIPVCMGLITSGKEESVGLVWAYGFLYEWAALVPVAVPCIVKEKQFYEVIHIYLPILILLSIAGVLIAVISKKKIKFRFNKLNRREIVYLGLFLAVVLFQMYKTIFYAYEDGDDAYYISVAQSAATSGVMYKKDAYMGMNTSVNYRYALAPFPIWLAVISTLSKVRVAALAHTVLPPVLITITYVIYNQIGKLLFGEDEKEKRYMFLTLVSVFVMFENVSTSTAGTFLLTRSRQGKEALANIILPLLFFEIFKLVKTDVDIKFTDFVLLVITTLAGSLTSLLANVLCPLMIFALLIYAIAKKKGIKKLAVIALSVIPNIIVALCYVIL